VEGVCSLCASQPAQGDNPDASKMNVVIHVYTDPQHTVKYCGRWVQTYPVCKQGQRARRMAGSCGEVEQAGFRTVQI
jgi:hypothetical protein